MGFFRRDAKKLLNTLKIYQKVGLKNKYLSPNLEKNQKTFLI